MSSLIVSKLRDTVRTWLLETRSSLENPQTPLSYPAEWLLDAFNGGRTDSGVRVSEMTSLQVSTVFACVQLIASTIGSLPLHVFELVIAKDKRTGKRIAPDHQAYELLRWQPNPEMTAFTFRKCLQAHALLWGNCYAEIQRDAANRPVGLWPRNPARTRPYRSAGELVYRTTEGMDEQTDVAGAPPNAPERTIDADDMLHLPGLTLDGRLGQSVIHLARQAIGLSLATEKYGAKYFGNGARPGGVLTHPGKLKGEARENLKKSWMEAQGGENAHRVAVLEEGMKFEASASENEAAQFLETRQFQKSEICSIFSVPPHMIGETDKTNRANTEQIALEFLTFTIGPWIESWEQEARRKLFPGVGRSAGKFFPKFEIRRLMMPDAESRRNFYASGKQWGYLSTNDIHEFEDLNPVDDPAADAYWMPVNMQEMGKPPKPQPPADESQAQDLPEEQNDLADRLADHLLTSYRRLFRDAVGRTLGRPFANRTQDAFRRTFEPLLAAIADGISTARSESFDRFLVGYLDILQSRAAGWIAEEIETTTDSELRRAIKAITTELCQSEVSQ
jgi:HK97 family phage portal protein